MLPVVATRGVLAKSSLVLLGIVFGFNASGRAEPPTVARLREQASRVLAPIAGQLRAAGLRQPVDVRRDKWGVAHIEAQNQQDLFFAQGLVAAQDRLFQMELWRRVGAGEMAELFGPEALEGDRFARLIRYRGDMEAEWKSYSPDTLEIATAFTAGINAWIEQCGDAAAPPSGRLAACSRMDRRARLARILVARTAAADSSTRGRLDRHREPQHPAARVSARDRVRLGVAVPLRPDSRASVDGKARECQEAYAGGFSEHSA